MTKTNAKQAIVKGPSSIKVSENSEIFICKELQNLIPTPDAKWMTPLQTENNPNPEKQLFSVAVNRLDCIGDVVAAQGFAMVIVSEGPWNKGAILAGDDQFNVANENGLPIKSEHIHCENLTFAKLFRWETEVSSQRILSCFLKLKAFLADDELRIWWETERPRRQSEGGKGKKQQTPFHRYKYLGELLNEPYWQVEKGYGIIKNYESPDKWKDFPEHYKEVAARIAKLIEGQIACDTVHNQLKNLRKRAVRKLHNDFQKTINNIRVNDGKWDGNWNQVVQANCLEVLPQFADCSVDRIVTSPFYFTDKVIYGADTVLPSTWEEYEAFMICFCKEAWRITKKDGWIIINVGDSSHNRDDDLQEFFPHRELFVNTFRELGCRHIQAKIWFKGYEAAQRWRLSGPTNPNNRSVMEHILIFRKGKRVDGFGAIMSKDDCKLWSCDVWGNIKTEPDKVKGVSHHPCVFPKELARRMALYGAHIGDTLLDPFCGSGKMLGIAVKEGLEVLGIDLNGHYVQRTQKAIENAVKDYEGEMQKIRVNKADF